MPLTTLEKQICRNTGVSEEKYAAQLAANTGAPNALGRFVADYISPTEKIIAEKMGLSHTAMAFGKARSTETLKSLGIALRDSAPYPSRSDAVDDEDDEDDEDDNDDDDDCDEDDELAAKRRAKKAEKALDDLIAKTAKKSKKKSSTALDHLIARKRAQASAPSRPIAPRRTFRATLEDDGKPGWAGWPTLGGAA